jgi:hypothetical protein
MRPRLARARVPIRKCLQARTRQGPSLGPSWSPEKVSAVTSKGNVGHSFRSMRRVEAAQNRPMSIKYSIKVLIAEIVGNENPNNLLRRVPRQEVSGNSITSVREGIP